MNNVILEVKKLVSEEKFNELKNELSSYEDFEAVYEEILKEIEEENLKNIDHDSEKNEDEEKKSILYFLYSEFYKKNLKSFDEITIEELKIEIDKCENLQPDNNFLDFVYSGYCESSEDEEE